MPFEKGTSGNPAGRPKGRPDARTKYRDLIEQQAPEIMAAAIRAALTGDGQALRICIDRICPAYRPVTEALPVAIDLSGNPCENSRAILQGVSDGVIAIDEATQLLQGIAATVKIIEATELEQRLQALEQEVSK